MGKGPAAAAARWRFPSPSCPQSLPTPTIFLSGGRVNPPLPSLSRCVRGGIIGYLDWSGLASREAILLLLLRLLPCCCWRRRSGIAGWSCGGLGDWRAVSSSSSCRSLLAELNLRGCAGDVGAGGADVDAVVGGGCCWPARHDPAAVQRHALPGRHQLRRYLTFSPPSSSSRKS